ncbi:MAG: hypothetical protein V4717_19180 [Bacteroidota bacterium]
MDQPLKYEQVIGQKLANLPIPDMEDMIWGRVKAQLDIDMPADDSDDDGDVPDVPPAGPRIKWRLPVLILAFVGALFFLKNKKNPVENTKQQPVITTPVPANSGQSAPPNLLNDTGKKKDPNSPASIIPPAANSQVIDSAIQQDTNFISPLITDTTANNPPAIINRENPPATTDTTQLKKKQRGVRDINDDDYKLVPKNKKDSL